MDNEALEFFGKTIMREIRDGSINDWNAIIDGRMKSERSRRIRDMLVNFEPEHTKIVLDLLPLIVDTTIYHLLWMLEQEKSIVVAINLHQAFSDDINEDSDGLAGELSGWAKSYSQYDYTSLV